MSKIHWTENKPVVLINNTTGIVLGYVETNAGSRQVRLHHIDLQYPIQIYGAIGRGKTTLVENMLRQLIKAGYGVLVFDPQGPLADRMLATAYEIGRFDDVLYFNLGDQAYPPAWSTLRHIPDASMIETFEVILYIFKAMYEGEWTDSMVRLQGSMQAFVDLALNDPDATILDLMDIALNPIYTKNLLHIYGNESVNMMAQRFWKRYLSMKGNQQEHLAGSAMNRIAGKLSNQHIINILCHPYGIDFRQIIRDRKIVIVDASSPSVEDSRAVLGTVLLAHLYLASRALGANLDERGKEKEPRFYMVLDEADMILNRGLFKSLNTKIRQFGMGQIYITQSMANYDNETAEIMMDNQGTAISLGTRNPRNAEYDAKLFYPNITADDLMKLSRGTVAITTRHNGADVPGFLMQTFDRTTISDINLQHLKDKAIKQIELFKGDGTRHTGLLPKSQVEAWLREREERDILSQDITGENDDEPEDTPPPEINPIPEGY